MEINFRMGEFYILFNNKEYYYKMKIKGRLFTYKGMEFGLQGNSKEGYCLTHIDSGMLANGKIYSKLNDFKQDMEATYNYLSGFSKEEINKAKEILKNAKEVKEEKKND